MIASKNSLCSSCEHLLYCLLTHDKSFIWSCSDYRSRKTEERNLQEVKPTGTLGISDNELTVV